MMRRRPACFFTMDCLSALLFSPSPPPFLNPPRPNNHLIYLMKITRLMIMTTIETACCVFDFATTTTLRYPKYPENGRGNPPFLLFLSFLNIFYII